MNLDATNNDAGDVQMGEEPNNETERVSRSVSVPDESAVQNLMVLRAKLGRQQQTPDMWRIVPPHQVKQALGFAEFPTQVRRDAVGGDKEDPAKAALRYTRNLVYVQHKQKIAEQARQLIQQGLPGLGQEARRIEAESLVDRLASELVAWAVYNEIPPSLVQEREDHEARMGQQCVQQTCKEVEAEAEKKLQAEVARRKQGVPALLANRMERDAIAMLGAKNNGGAAPDGGPLPSSNLALRDYHDPKTSKPQAPTVAAAKSVITLLAQAITGRDPKTGRPRSGAILLERARLLSNGDGVVVVQQQNQDAKIVKAIVVRAIEAQALLRAPKEQLDGFMLESRKAIESWANLRAESRDKTLGLERCSLMTGDGKNSELVDFTKVTGTMLRNPPKEDRALGLDFGSNRKAYFRKNPNSGVGNAASMFDDGMPPLRTGVPLSRDLLMGFVYQHYPDLKAASLWYLMPDMVVPCCPAINILVDGITPFHMSAYTLLEEYIALMRAAIDRISTPSVGPPGKASSGHQGIMTADDLIRAEPRSNATKIRGKLLCRLFQEAHPGEFGWFVPEAVLPIPNNPQELEMLYPRDDPALHPWLRQLVQQQALRGCSYAVRLDVFDKLCKEADRQMAVSEQGKRRRAETQQAIQDTLKSKHTGVGEPIDPFESHPELQAYLDKVSEPDCSREGRAETILGLTVIWMHTCIQRQYLLQYHNHLEQLRQEYGPGNDCGNGYRQVRPAEYYDKLFELCLSYTAQTLETYELCLLLISSRWIDLPKARFHRIPMAMRLQSEYVAKAHPDTVAQTLANREKNLADRIDLDPKLHPLRKGFARMPDPQGRFGADSEDWTARPLISKRIRPDCPTYAQMILFDHLLDSSTDASAFLKRESELGTATITDTDDPAVDDLSQRMRAMVMRDAKFVQDNPRLALRQHELPGNKPPKTDTKRGMETDNHDSDSSTSSGKRSRSA